jgi:hypothetical protein
MPSKPRDKSESDVSGMIYLQGAREPLGMYLML